MSVFTICKGCGRETECQMQQNGAMLCPPCEEKGINIRDEILEDMELFRNF